MKQNSIILLTLFLISLLLTLTAPSTAHAQASVPVVRAILFYSPSCPHCHQVITEDIPPLFEKYGNQLDIIGIDVSQPVGQTLYQAAIQRFSIPENRLGVPTLIVANIIMVGSREIPDQFPGLIEQYLSQGGVDWPDIPGLRESLPPTPKVEESMSTAQPQAGDNLSTATSPSQSTALLPTPMPATITPSFVSPTATPGLILTSEQNSNWRDLLARDPAGNTLAIFVLIGMLTAVLWVIITLFNNQIRISFKSNWPWLIPSLCLIGFGVAGYLAYVETAQVTAVCGPVGDCNTVQQSEYARLFGILPIGVLGLIGYVFIGAFWFIAYYGSGSLANLANLALFATTTSGTLFSIYLTFLEPFVIGATCAWCLTSAILMTLLMLLTVSPAKATLSRFVKIRSYL